MKNKLATWVRLISVLFLFSQSGCWECQVEREFNHPVRPSNVHGWAGFQHGSVTVDPDFVLGVGESVDNGRVGVRIVSVTPAKCSLFKEPETPSARIQFYEVSDRSVICESIFQPGSAFLRRPHVCGEEFEWDIIGISAVNAGEKWVAFELGK
jgi:hypothetical protein